MNKYAAEFIGTFFLVLTIGATVLGGNPSAIAPLAIGSALMVMVFANGYISGAHFNPAVTLAVFLRGRLPASDLLPYWVSQILGAWAAAFVSMYLRPGARIGTATLDVPRALTAEFFFTLMLAYVVLNVATSKGTQGNPTYGLAIGFTVMTGAFAVGDIAGGAFNPAVAIAATLMGLSAWANLWIYVVACMAGGAAAAVVFRLLNPTDR